MISGLLVDVFFRQKCDTFSRSNQAVFELSQRFSTPHKHEEGLSEAQKLEKNKLIFLELTQGELQYEICESELTSSLSLG